MTHADLSVLRDAVIAFDLDGTLVETAPDLVGALNAVLTEQGLAPLPFEEARMLVGRGAAALLLRGFEAAGEPLDDAHKPVLIERFITVYRARIADESRPFPGCLAALDALIAAGARLVVCTNKRTDLSVALIDALGMTSRFVAIIGADAAPAAKPDPRHVLAAIEAAGGARERAVMVGDSHNDIDAALAAQVPSIAVTFGYTDTPARQLGADSVIEHFDELVAACADLLGSCS
jgi:phosphoglycolate phosphatase